MHINSTRKNVHVGAQYIVRCLDILEWLVPLCATVFKPSCVCVVASYLGHKFLRFGTSIPCDDSRSNPWKVCELHAKPQIMIPGRKEQETASNMATPRLEWQELQSGSAMSPPCLCDVSPASVVERHALISAYLARAKLGVFFPFSTGWLGDFVDLWKWCSSTSSHRWKLNSDYSNSWSWLVCQIPGLAQTHNDSKCFKTSSYLWGCYHFLSNKLTPGKFSATKLPKTPISLNSSASFK